MGVVKMTDKEKTTPKVAVGYWRTRSGDRAYVAAICDPFNHGELAVGFVGYKTQTWHLTGRCDACNERPEDLIEPWRDKVSGEMWCIVYKNGERGFSMHGPLCNTAHQERVVKVRYEEIADD